MRELSPLALIWVIAFNALVAVESEMPTCLSKYKVGFLPSQQGCLVVLATALAVLMINTNKGPNKGNFFHLL